MKKQIVISIVITSIICLPAGAFIGGKYLFKCNFSKFVELNAMEEYHHLNILVIIFETLNKGKVQEVIDIVYADINALSKQEPDYSKFDLSDSTKKNIMISRQRAREAIVQYPNPKFNDCN